MRKVILYSAQSLDGYIAKKDGNIDWLHDQRLTLEGQDYGYAQFYESIDTVLQGYSTYKLIEDMGIENPYEGKKNYVFSRKTGLQSNQSTTFTNENPASLVKKLKVEEGKDIWLIGGGQINGQLLQEKLIDELILTIIPVVLGEGIRIFDTSQLENWFRLLSCKSYDNGMVQMHFEAL
ncbi:dihydrofolate reductase family protein [Jiulongibacter sediminis]|uniref:dihydrofolate reductase family protein n=1 Tax=Jiulongibacter sediminis TaxID=1605367 RepID=UPI0026F1DFDD|nr:dihydrofolate reductase family protein [Jiulongibacter sediminis]